MDSKTQQHPQVIFVDVQEANTAIVPVKPKWPMSAPIRPELDQRTLDRRALVNLSLLMNSALARFCIVERCGRICLVEFAPINNPDPLLPVPAFPLPEPLQIALRGFARHVARWNPYDNQGQWHNHAVTLLSKATAQLQRHARLFDDDELRFMLDHLSWCLVSPDGKQRL